MSPTQQGHPLGVNRAVPIEYPKLRARYGDEVTYIEDPKRHIMVEFAFDVVQVASGAFLPQAYHDFIGFEVATDLVERAFRDTYGIEMKDVFASEDLAVGTFRYAVSTTDPADDAGGVGEKARRDREAGSDCPAECVRLYLHTGAVRTRIRNEVPAAGNLRALLRVGGSRAAEGRTIQAAGSSRRRRPRPNACSPRVSRRRVSGIAPCCRASSEPPRSAQHRFRYR
jgi:hypothetical protein